MMDDIITSITDSYKNAAEFQNFLNQNPADSRNSFHFEDIPCDATCGNTFETSDEDLEELDRLYQSIS